MGGSGFVGRNLVEFFAARQPVIATYFHSKVQGDSDLPVTWVNLDARSRDDVAKVVAAAAPAVVIHAAGNKNVGWCQSHPADADAVNGEAVAHVARACQRTGARLIYLSTDLVFDGRTGGYREDDLPAPATIYGHSKLHGEQWARAEYPEVTICRSGGIYGNRSPLLAWAAAQLRGGKMVEAFTDVHNTPTYVVNLAEMMVRIIDLSRSGTFHTAGSQSVNRLEFFREFVGYFQLPPALVVGAIGGAQRDRMLLQPDSSLNTGATQTALDLSFDSVASGMARLAQEGAEF